ncbi:MAG: DUF2298 domain-containing protein [Halobacteriaceae archaeon]
MEVVPVVAWWVLFQGLLLAAAPLSALIAPRMPDRGLSLALPLGTLVVTIPTYWIGQLVYGPVAVLVGAALLAGLSVFASRRTTVDRRRYAETAAVFTVAFLFLVVVRAVDPAVHAGGGEKFLDFGLLQALLRTDQLPPEDMWFAGKPVLYYYGGHLVASIWATLTATPGRLAYNLALPGFYAMAVTAAYGIAAAIAEARGAPRRLAGLLGGFFYGFASNLFTPAGLVAGALGPGAVEAVAAAVEKRPGKIWVSTDTFSYWYASRVIPRTINEFPLFAFVNGDMHAHMMSVPFTLLVVGVAYAYYRTPREQTLRRRVLLFGVVPPVAGYVAVVNTWSFPTVLGITWLAATFAPAPPWTLFPTRLRRAVGRRVRGRAASAGRELGRPLCAAGLAVAVGLLGLAWVAPFLGNVLLAGARSQRLGFLPERSPLLPFLLVHGAFLAVFSLYFAGHLGRSPGRRLAGLAVIAPLAALLGRQFNLVGLALVGPVLAVGWYLARRDERSRWPDGVGFETLLVIGGAGIVLLVEFVFLNDSAGGGRYNTVFKTYGQVWALWAPAAGSILAALYVRESSLLARVTDRVPDLNADVSVPQAARALAIAGLVVTLSVYGGFAMVQHASLSRSNPTLDALQFAHEKHPEEARAIEWLSRKRGQPNIVSAPGLQIYQWVNAPSSLTGIPTVVGWIHESGYRGRDPYFKRVKDVRRIYQGSAATRARLLRRYDVAYIYVGPIETDRYGDVTYGDEPGIRRVWASSDRELATVRIYAVDQTELIGGAAA